MRPAVIEIARAVLPHFGMGDSFLLDLELRDRHGSLAQARAVVCWVVRKRLTYMSYPELGKELGRRDHKTCLSLVRRVRDTPELLKVAEAVVAALALRDELPSGVVAASARATVHEAVVA